MDQNADGYTDAGGGVSRFLDHATPPDGDDLDAIFPAHPRWSQAQFMEPPGRSAHPSDRPRGRSPTERNKMPAERPEADRPTPAETGPTGQTSESFDASALAALQGLLGQPGDTSGASVPPPGDVTPPSNAASLVEEQHMAAVPEPGTAEPPLAAAAAGSTDPFRPMMDAQFVAAPGARANPLDRQHQYSQHDVMARMKGAAERPPWSEAEARFRAQRLDISPPAPAGVDPGPAPVLPAHMVNDPALYAATALERLEEIDDEQAPWFRYRLE